MRVSVLVLGKAEASAYADHYFTMNFSDKPVAMDSFKAGEECVEMGSRKCKVFSIVDVDSTGLPSLVRPFTNIEVNNTEMPVDLVSMIDSIPGRTDSGLQPDDFHARPEERACRTGKEEEPPCQHPLIHRTRWPWRTSSGCKTP